MTARSLVVYCLGFLLLTSGCSVGMAMSGKKNPNLGAIHEGSSRGEVELQLGSPIRSLTHMDGTRTDIYEYEIGNEPSAGRAVGHGVMDLLTLGLWEVVGTPIEGVQGDKYEITLLYDEDDRVQAINNTRKIEHKPKKSQTAEAKKDAKEEARPIKVKVVGLSDQANDGIQQDRKEAILDAKRQACEQAGIKISSQTSLQDMQVFEEKVDSEAESVLLPGYEVVELGYKEDGCTFQVVLIGQVKAVAETAAAE